MSDSVWSEKGATLSDKSACKEFFITQKEIIEAIQGGKLQYRRQYMHGNPYLKLIRNEIETMVKEKYGKNHLEKKKLENELNQVNKELKRLKAKMAALEQRKGFLIQQIGGE